MTYSQIKNNTKQTPRVNSSSYRNKMPKSNSKKKILSESWKNYKKI